MEVYKVMLTSQAKHHLYQIRDYIAVELLSPSLASDMLKYLKEEIKNLSYLPRRNPRISEKPWGSKGVRKLIMKNYYVYYIVSENDKLVKVFAIIYGRRDQVAILGETEQR